MNYEINLLHPVAVVAKRLHGAVAAVETHE